MIKLESISALVIIIFSFLILGFSTQETEEKILSYLESNRNVDARIALSWKLKTMTYRGGWLICGYNDRMLKDAVAAWWCGDNQIFSVNGIAGSWTPFEYTYNIDASSAMDECSRLINKGNNDVRQDKEIELIDVSVNKKTYTNGVYVLEGIYYDPQINKISALINGNVFFEGDKIGDIKIERINNNSIDVMINSQKKRLELGQRIDLQQK